MPALQFCYCRVMQPNTLIFVDFPSDDVEACARFYHDVFGWEVEGRPTGVFHRGVPGGHFPLEDGSPSPIGNLHVGFNDVNNARPHPDPAGVEPRHLSRDGRAECRRQSRGHMSLRRF